MTISPPFKPPRRSLQAAFSRVRRRSPDKPLAAGRRPALRGRGPFALKPPASRQDAAVTARGRAIAILCSNRDGRCALTSRPTLPGRRPLPKRQVGAWGRPVPRGTVEGGISTVDIPTFPLRHVGLGAPRRDVRSTIRAPPAKSRPEPRHAIVVDRLEDLSLRSCDCSHIGRSCTCRPSPRYPSQTIAFPAR